MALTGTQKAYLQARSGIARSGAIRSNYVFPLFGVITVNGLDLTEHILYGSLKITMALNEEPDTASFDVLLTDSAIQAALVVGADVVIGLGGPAENVLFGGRILTAQTTWGPARTPSLCSVMCADYLQVLDSENLITYGWPAQSATTTILDLMARFANRPGGVAISTAGVQAGLPSHASLGVINERFSTFLRRVVTMFPDGGGFYVDPLKGLHVWTGGSEPNVVNPRPLTLANPTLKTFAVTVDGSQQRDAAIVEGRRTTAPIGTAGPDTADPTGRLIYSMPVVDASILDKIADTGGAFQEVRIGTQRFKFQIADGVWSAPAGTPLTTIVTADVPFNPDPSVEDNKVSIPIESDVLFTGRTRPWVRLDEQVLRVLDLHPGPVIVVPRTGWGSMSGEIHAEAVITVIDALANGEPTGRYEVAGSPEKVRAQPIDSDVVMVVRSGTGPAIHEQIVQDGRYSRSGATARGAAEILDFNQPLVSIQFETDDLNARPGRLQAYNLGEPPLTPLVGEHMILSAELTWPVWGQPPRRQCYATDVRGADIVDAWLVDPR